MEYETAAQFIELLAMVIMAAAFYYGHSLKGHTKGTGSLQLVVLALFYDLAEGSISLLVRDWGGGHRLGNLACHNNTCAARVKADVSECKRVMRLGVWDAGRGLSGAERPPSMKTQPHFQNK